MYGERFGDLAALVARPQNSVSGFRNRRTKSMCASVRPTPGCTSDGLVIRRSSFIRATGLR
jgi:hypothetical protein